MNVKQLQAALKNLPPNQEIIMASDEEGNSFHPIMEVAAISHTQFAIWPKHEEAEIKETD